MMLLKILENSQEITCVGVSFLIKLACNFNKKETPTQMLSCKFIVILYLFYRTPPVAVYVFRRISVLRSSSPELFCKKDVLKFFAKFVIPQLSASSSQLSNPRGRTKLILKEMLKRKHGLICLALVSKLNHPKKYQVSKRFFIRNKFISTSLYKFSFS